MKNVTIIGAGLAGLAAAEELASQHIGSLLVSAQISERAQSVLAEGGINAAMDVMGENDTAAEHFADTMRGGADLADPEAVRDLTERAPEVVRHMAALGTPFTMNGMELIQRNFGGQKKKRTAYCKSSTGKALMTAMIDAVRRYEEEGLVIRYPHHVLTDLITENGRCRGAVIRDTWTEQELRLPGPVILAFGGPHGMLPGQTTGTTANDGNGLAIAFFRGVEAANLEFLQYHPTTVGIAAKRLLISEAARGEGGRLFAERGGQRWYFMEEKYPELGNLMPRDVVSREMDAVRRDPSCSDRIWLDMTGLPKETWKKKLPDLREEVQHYLGIDPAKEPVPVSPGIHYFMGGIHVDRGHRTNVSGLYAAGECACQYHGANRLGGNSLLGALYGGQVAAQTAAKETEGRNPGDPESREDQSWRQDYKTEISQVQGTHEGALMQGTAAQADAEQDAAESKADKCSLQQREAHTASPQITDRVMRILMQSMGIVRDAGMIEQGLRELEEVRRDGKCTDTDRKRMLVAEAMLRSARERKESRGAHQRSDYPERDDEHFRKTTVARWDGTEIRISFREINSVRDIT